MRSSMFCNYQTSSVAFASLNRGKELSVLRWEELGFENGLSGEYKSESCICKTVECFEI